MPERPLLVFPKPVLTNRPPGHGGGGEFPHPYNKRGRMQRINKQLDHIWDEFRLDDSGDIEKILVVETIGTIADFRKAVEKIPKLEWLAEIVEDEIEAVDLDFLYGQTKKGKKDKDKAKKMGGRFCLAATNRQAANELRDYWKIWKDGGKLRYGYGVWERLFEQIYIIRLWDHKDMLRNTGFLDEFQEIIKKGETADRKTTIDFEVELHYRSNPLDRDKAQREVVKEIRNVGGKVTGFVDIKEVRFHGLKITLPIAVLRPLISENEEDKKRLTYLLPSRVKYYRPMSMLIPRKISDDSITEEKDMAFPGCNNDPPIIALLDGAPLLNHELLVGRIKFEDPDDCLSQYKDNENKEHGTAMASLICHGDLKAKHSPLPRKIYVRPILVADNKKKAEKIQDKVFLEDIIMRSVREMFGGIDNVAATAKTVRIINFSIGNPKKIFLYEVSPAARVLDYLSWTYNVLFIISAGNQPDANFDFNDEDMESINVPSFPPEKGITSSTIIRAVDKRQKEWRIIEPAESINGLTVGAVNEDEFKNAGDADRGIFDPLEKHCVGALYSRLGNGFGRQIKPDILVAGGKSHYVTLDGKSDRMEDGKLYYVLGEKSYYRLRNGRLKQNKGYREQGLVSAYPSSSMSENLKYKETTFGTSNSAALTTHAAGELYEILEEIKKEHPDSFDDEYNALLIKALLVHGASRANISSIYERVLRGNMNEGEWKEYFSRYCGYGIPDFERVKECTSRRVVSLGYGDIEEGKQHVFLLPIPPRCKQINKIKLIVTLAWFSPIVPSHRLLRQAKLSFEVSGIGKRKRPEYNSRQVKKGTLQHEIFELSSRELDDQINISVDCYSAIGSLDKVIPYSLVSTLEVSEDIDIYEYIKNEIAQKVPV